MNIEEQKSLLPYNTFGLEASCRYFAEINSVDEISPLLQKKLEPIMVLGGGSNILFTQNFEGLILKNNIKGIQVETELEDQVWVRAGGGESWHDFVMWCVAHQYGGVENMSLIPGTVGAAPIQNIGAYGVELKDVFISLEALDLKTGEKSTFSKDLCQFGYRNSIFKQEAKGRYCITSVLFSLTKSPHQINASYGDIQKVLADKGIVKPSIANLSQAVIDIRTSKLPDPAKIGNCGSFFKNPETDRIVLDRIRVTHPQAPGYDLPDGRVKIPAGWLIEQCGWKGKRVGNTGSYEKQALVLVNHGGAQGAEVKALAYAIIDSIQQAFGVTLEAEVNMV